MEWWTSPLRGPALPLRAVGRARGQRARALPHRPARSRARCPPPPPTVAPLAHNPTGPTVVFVSNRTGIPFRTPRPLELRSPKRRGGERDAAQDSPQPGAEALVVRLRDGAPGRASAASHRGGGPTPRQCPREVLAVRTCGAGRRHVAATVLRVRGAVAHSGGVSLRDAPGGVCALRGEGRVRPVGDGQAPGDRHLRLVPRRMGEAAVVAGGGHGVPQLVGHRLPVGAHGGRVGSCAS